MKIEPRQILDLMEILLMELERSLEAAPTMSEDARTDNLKHQIADYRNKTQRLKTVLQKHKAHERRKREIDRQNRRNSS